MKNFKDSYFVKTLKLTKKEPKTVFYIILLDLLFLAAISIFYKLVEFFFLKTPPEISTATTTLYLIVTLAYYLILILIYSFFKYSVLNSISSMFKKTKLSFIHMKKFYLLNLSIFAVFMVAFLLLNGTVLTGTKEEYRAYIFLITNLPLLLVFYTFMNISHTIFSESKNSGIKETVKKTFTEISKIKNYLGVFLTNTALIIVYFTMFYFIGLILKYTLFKSYSAAAQYNNTYSIIFTVITTIFFYSVILFNRIYFYSIIKNKKQNVLP
ncbi:hypothetical protein ISS05_02470 [Candidatus Woesearchaeota archaeon]|nr:hypothetical protein [Candidatus Woesearchaeota archaeon]